MSNHPRHPECIEAIKEDIIGGVIDTTAPITIITDKTKNTWGDTQRGNSIQIKTKMRSSLKTKRALLSHVLSDRENKINTKVSCCKLKCK